VLFGEGEDNEEGLTPLLDALFYRKANRNEEEVKKKRGLRPSE
jgi:hypothetical protein